MKEKKYKAQGKQFYSPRQFYSNYLPFEFEFLNQNGKNTYFAYIAYRDPTQVLKENICHITNTNVKENKSRSKNKKILFLNSGQLKMPDIKMA